LTNLTIPMLGRIIGVDPIYHDVISGSQRSRHGAQPREGDDMHVSKGVDVHVPRQIHVRSDFLRLGEFVVGVPS